MIPRLLRASLLLAAVGCAPLSPPPPTAPAVERVASPGAELLALVPNPAQSVLSVDVRRLRASPWARPVLTWAADREAGGDGSRGGRGFDEVQDVDRWVFARVGDASLGRGTLELARGRFEARQVLDAFVARWPAAQPVGFAGLSGAADGEHAVVLLDARTVAFGPPSAVQAAAVAARSLGRRGATAADAPWLTGVQAALSNETTGSPKGLAVELAFVVERDARPAVAEVLGSEVPVEHLGARLFLDRQARAVLVGLADGEGDAQALAGDVSQHVRALAARRSVRALALAPMLKRASVVARGSRVVLQMEVSEDERSLVSEKLAALAAVLAKSPPASAGAPPAPAEPAPPPGETAPLPP